MPIALETRSLLQDYSVRTESALAPAIQSESIQLAQARDIFVAKEAKKKKQVVAYEIDQDRIAYTELGRHAGKEGYDKAKENLDAYTRMQVETHLGERLNVESSRFHFTIENDQLMPDNSDESMLSMMQRGQEYRRQHGSPVDWAREEAEVYGFEETQKVLTDRQIPVGTMMLSISPQGDVANGSIYKMNFYDVYQKTEDGIDAYRFTSGLDREESQKKVKQFDLRYAKDAIPADVDFLARPVRIDPKHTNLQTPQDVHNYLHKEHDHMAKEEFENIIKTCAPLITGYINTLSNNPAAVLEHERRFTALLNGADEVADTFKKKAYNTNEEKQHIIPWYVSESELDRLAAKAVRPVDTGCGFSGGTSSKIFSVAEFSKGVSIGGSPGKDKYGDRSFACPACGAMNVRPENELLSTCQSCNSTEVAC